MILPEEPLVINTIITCKRCFMQCFSSLCYCIIKSLGLDLLNLHNCRTKTCNREASGAVSSVCSRIALTFLILERAWIQTGTYGVNGSSLDFWGFGGFFVKEFLLCNSRLYLQACVVRGFLVSSQEQPQNRPTGWFRAYGIIAVPRLQPASWNHKNQTNNRICLVQKIFPNPERCLLLYFREWGGRRIPLLWVQSQGTAGTFVFCPVKEDG